MRNKGKLRLDAAQLEAALAADPEGWLVGGGVHAHIAPFDPETSRIRFGLTANGTFHLVGKVTDWDVDNQSTEPRTREWLGGEDERPPRRITRSGSVQTFLDTGDTNGQVALQTAQDDGVPGFMQVCPEGTTIGDTVYQIEVWVTGVRWQMGGIDGAGLTANYTWRAVLGAEWTEVVLAA